MFCIIQGVFKEWFSKLIINEIHIRILRSIKNIFHLLFFCVGIPSVRKKCVFFSPKIIKKDNFLWIEVLYWSLFKSCRHWWRGLLEEYLKIYLFCSFPKILPLVIVYISMATIPQFRPLLWVLKGVNQLQMLLWISWASFSILLVLRYIFLCFFEEAWLLSILFTYPFADFFVHFGIYWYLLRGTLFKT